MKSKKAQSDMITTILLILVALAAVAVIAVFITNQVRGSAATATARAQCTKLGFVVSQAKAGGSISVQRTDAEKITVSYLKTNVAGLVWNSSAASPNTLETGLISNLTAPLVIGQTIDVGAILSDGTACASVAGGTVTG